MLYSDPKIIFIHVSKTGGSSIAKFLKDYENNGELKERDNKFDNHVTLQYIHDQGINLNEYTIFAIKRNTWERIVSFYLMCYKGNGEFTFPLDWQNDLRDKTYVSFSNFYNIITPNHRPKNYFHYLEVNGKIPAHVSLLDFNNLEQHTKHYWNSLGFPSHKQFSHKKENKREELKKYLLSDPEFIEVIGEKYKREIEYFGFEPPSVWSTLNVNVIS